MEMKIDDRYDLIREPDSGIPSSARIREYQNTVK